MKYVLYALTVILTAAGAGVLAYGLVHSDPSGAGSVDADRATLGFLLIFGGMLTLLLAVVRKPVQAGEETAQ